VSGLIDPITGKKFGGEHFLEEDVKVLLAIPIKHGRGRCNCMAL
jgi:hypothetical protein